jgi:hypothetical protein
MGLASARRRHPWDCRRIHWFTGWGGSSQIVEVVTSPLPPMCDCLYRLLGSLWSRTTEQATSSGGQSETTRSWGFPPWAIVSRRDGRNQLHWTIQQYIEATSFSVSAKNFVLFQIIRKSHWCNLVFYPLLQWIITCLALPASVLPLIAVRRWSPIKHCLKVYKCWH